MSDGSEAATNIFVAAANDAPAAGPEAAAINATIS
jgi:hypothetical protein